MSIAFKEPTQGVAKACSKHTFLTGLAAWDEMQVVNKFVKQKLTYFYQCRYCGYFHTTSLSKERGRKLNLENQPVLAIAANERTPQYKLLQIAFLGSDDEMLVLASNPSIDVNVMLALRHSGCIEVREVLASRTDLTPELQRSLMHDVRPVQEVLASNHHADPLILASLAVLDSSLAEIVYSNPSRSQSLTPLKVKKSYRTKPSSDRKVKVDMPEAPRVSFEQARSSLQAYIPTPAQMPKKGQSVIAVPMAVPAVMEADEPVAPEREPEALIHGMDITAYIMKRHQKLMGADYLFRMMVYLTAKNWDPELGVVRSRRHYLMKFLDISEATLAVYLSKIRKTGLWKVESTFIKDREAVMFTPLFLDEMKRK